MQSAPAAHLLSPACPPGRLTWTDPPLVERRALAFNSISSHRPSRLSARRAMSLFGSGCGCPLPSPLSPIHADPVARAIGRWCQSEPLSSRPVGVAPDSLGSEPLLPRRSCLLLGRLGAPAVACRECRLPLQSVSRCPVEVAGEHCPIPHPLGVVDHVGWAEAPSSSPRFACAVRNVRQ
jgi:hypothetical protein